MLTLLTMVILWILFNMLIKAKSALNLGMLMMISMLSMMNMKTGVSPLSFCSMMSAMTNFAVVMVILSIWISSMMILVSLNYQYENKSSNIFIITVSILTIVVILFFMTDNLLGMYLFFEISLIPTLALIMKWGYQPERLQASFYFVMYTICVSLPLLFMIMKMKTGIYSFAICSFMPFINMEMKFNYHLFYLITILAFLVKAPMWGTHLWLPKAHVEAPISGSMVLAGILLKLGGYGLMQVLSVSHKLNSSMTNLCYSINLWGALIVGLVCLSSVDMKVLIAYSSVIHMNLMVLGILSNSPVGVKGAMLMMVAHGISSPGMFALANLNYQKTKSRNMLLQKGLTQIQPTLTLMWFLLMAANMAAPPSLNLASEILICVSVLKTTMVSFMILGVITFLGGAYNLYLFSAQQGNLTMMMKPSKNFNSSDYLMMISFTMPVYMLTFMLINLC